MNTARLVLLGAGGHCRSVIDTLSRSDAFRIEGILDPHTNAAVDGVPVLGGDDRIPELAAQDFFFLVTVGDVNGTSDVRARLYQAVTDHGGRLATIVSPLAHVARTAMLGAGTWVGHHAIIGPGVRCGENTIINTAALIEHDSMVGSHVHVSTRAVINGGCSVGDSSFIGSGAVIKQGVRIGQGCIVGAGAVVLSDVPDDTTMVGVPARPIAR